MSRQVGLGIELTDWVNYNWYIKLLSGINRDKTKGKIVSYFWYKFDSEMIHKLLFAKDVLRSYRR